MFEKLYEEYRTMSAEVQIPMNVNPMKKVKKTIIKREVLIVASIVVLCGVFLLANII